MCIKRTKSLVYIRKRGLVSRVLTSVSLVGKIKCEQALHKAQRQVVETTTSWLCGLCA